MQSRSRSILIVDDNPALLAALTDMLTQHLLGVSIFHALCGAEALARFDQHRPQVVLMDVHLPDGDGLTITRHMLAAAPDTRVVVISMRMDSRIAEDAMAAGAFAFVPKDRLGSDLPGAITRALDGAEWQR